MDSFGNTLWLVPINSFRPAGCYCTKAATARADVPKDHKCCCAFAPAFAHVRAVATFANGVKFMFVNKAADMFVIFANRQFHTKPVWLLHSCLVFVDVIYNW